MNRDDPTRIHVVCPECGHDQSEAKVAVSTFCKQCGVHIRIEKIRRIMGFKTEYVFKASPVTNMGLGVNSYDSSVSMPKECDEENLPKGSSPALSRPPRPASPWVKEEALADYDAPFIKPKPEPAPTQFDDEGLSEPKFIEPKPGPPVANAPAPYVDDLFANAPETFLTRRIKNFHKSERQKPNASPNPQAAPQGPASPSVAKSLGKSTPVSPYFREAVCFECHHSHQAGRNSKTSICPNCGATIQLNNVEITNECPDTILTRGNVIIHPEGTLTSTRVECQNLEVHGAILSPVTCEGDLILGHNVTIDVDLSCGRLLLPADTTATLLRPIFSYQADIKGLCIGDLVCHGAVTIFPGGSVDGNISAYSVKIEPGGELNGTMKILRRTS